MVEHVFKAVHRFARMSPRKVRLVMDQIRGKPVNDALNVLEFNTRRGAYMIRKVLRSALANAEHQVSEHGYEVDIDSLFVSEGRVDDGPTWKRRRPRARGRAFPILKRTCHIIVCLSPAGE